MSSYGLDYRRKRKDKLVTEHECMIKFYEPIENRDHILKKWLKQPER